jgi:formylglycine-generating enzyme required for sulfatase activity
MNAYIHLLSLILLSFLMASCSKNTKITADVSGQIFVITKGAENIKIGGAKVSVISDEEFLKIAKQMSEWLTEEISNANQNRVDVKHMIDFTKKLEEAYSIGDFEAPTEWCKRKSAYIKQESGIDGQLIDLAESIWLYEKLYEENSKSEDLKSMWYWRNKMSNTVFEQAKKKIISDISKATSAVVMTDADGIFTVPVMGKVWFLSSAERAVGNEKENYLWIKSFQVPEDGSKARVQITNEDLIDTEKSIYEFMVKASGHTIEADPFEATNPSPKIVSLIGQCVVEIAEWREEKERAREKVEEQSVQEAIDAKLRAKNEATELKEKLRTSLGDGKVGIAINVPISNDMLMGMVWCQPGEFKMGVSASEKIKTSDSDEVNVKISKGFWMARTEITRSQWVSVMEKIPDGMKSDNLPILNVSWNEAQEFITKVNSSGILPDGWKFALPTEAQWEYACRSGSVGPNSGGNLDEVGWYVKNSVGKPNPVGLKKPNEWGLYDMQGNVSEWCADFYAEDLAGGTDPEGPSSGGWRVHRGGSMRSNPAGLRAVDRGRESQDSSRNDLGFRPVLVVTN